jgi:hypothetical protein
MEVLRLYDPERRPPNWSDIVRPTQFVAFSSNVDSGGVTDADGAPFPSTAAATCLVFDSLAEARRFCETRVGERAAVRFEIFDARGRVEAPLVVIVSPSRAGALEGSSRTIRLRKWAAIVLLAGGPPLIWYDYWNADGALILPAFLGISMALAGLRLLFLNMAVREAERTRRKRLERYE